MPSGGLDTRWKLSLQEDLIYTKVSLPFGRTNYYLGGSTRWQLNNTLEWLKEKPIKLQRECVRWGQKRSRLQRVKTKENLELQADRKAFLQHRKKEAKDRFHSFQLPHSL